MRKTLGLVTAVVLISAVGLPSGGAATPAEVGSVAYDDASPGLAPTESADAQYVGLNGERLGTASELGIVSVSETAAAAELTALGCTPVSGRDNPHRSSTGVAVSAHGWWDKGTCKNGKADVVNCIYEWYTDHTWRAKKCSSVVTLTPGGGSGNRTTARLNCSTTHATSWRNHVNVDVKWEVDTNEIPYRQADVACRVP